MTNITKKKKSLVLLTYERGKIFENLKTCVGKKVETRVKKDLEKLI